MNDEYDELYNMLSSDKEDVRKIKDNFKDDISYYLTKIKNYQANTIDISGNYDLEKEKDAEFLVVLKKYVDKYGSIEEAWNHRDEFTEKEYDKFKMDDIALRFNLNDECLNYKLILLSKYMEELKKERQFLEFKRSKEDLMSKQEYQEYLRNDLYRNDLVSKWYKEFETGI